MAGKAIAKNDPRKGDILAVDPARIREIVKALPSGKRAAMSKALKAACQHLKDSKGNYDQAFELSCAMADNWWHLGRELKKLRKEGLLRVGAPTTDYSAPGHHCVSLSDIGVNKRQSSRCQRLADMTEGQLKKWKGNQYDAEKYTLVTLRSGASAARQKKTKSDKSPDLKKTHPGVRQGDFQEVLGGVFDVDAIITDPPYGKKYLHLWEALGEFAAERLSDHGMLIAYSGQMYLPDVFATLGKHLEHWWTLAVVHEGSGNLTPLGQPVRQVINKWKPVVMFFKPGGHPEEAVFKDIIPSSKPDKHNHNWAQSLQEAVWLIEQFTMQDATVVDPMAGGGTVGYACDLTGRQFIGAEIKNGRTEEDS